MFPHVPPVVFRLRVPAPGGEEPRSHPKQAHPPSVMAQVRDLVENTTLIFKTIGVRTRVNSGTISRWAEKHGWKRPPGAWPPNRRPERRYVPAVIGPPGGAIHAGLAIYDTMQYVISTSKCKITTLCYGLAASFGAILLAGGSKGMRYALPNATILIHQPWTQQSGVRQASDIEIEAREMLRVRSRLNDILAKHTGQPLERIQRDTDRDYYMTAEQAVEYGLIDDIMTTVPAEVPQAAG